MKSAISSMAAIGYVLVIFYLSVISADSLGAIYYHVGITRIIVKLLHVAVFFLMALLLRLAFSTQFYQKWIQDSRSWSACVTLGLAALLLFVKVLIPTRHARLSDLILHFAGIFFFFIVDWSIEKKYRWSECK